MSFMVTQWYVGSNIHQKGICVYKYLSVEFIFLTLPTTTLVFDGADGQVTDNKIKKNNNNGRATLKQHW